MRSKEKKFGVLIVESDGASSKERENSRNGEDGIKGCSINVGVLSDPTGRVLSGNWDMYPEGRPEGALPLLGMRSRLGSEQGPVGGGCCGRVDADCDEWGGCADPADGWEGLGGMMEGDGARGGSLVGHPISFYWLGPFRAP